MDVDYNRCTLIPSLEITGGGEINKANISAGDCWSVNLSEETIQAFN